MKVIELLKIVEGSAAEYRHQAIDSIKMNKHMHDCSMEDIGSQDFVDAILSNFINFLASNHNVDYGIKASDLYWPESRDEWKKIQELNRKDLSGADKREIEWDKTMEQKRKQTTKGDAL